MYSIDAFAKEAFKEGKLKSKQLTDRRHANFENIDHNNIKKYNLGDLFPDIAPIIKGS
jgi:hypothetical protein